eukprot:16448522-Heterocapsa_arctica.AAC.1
MGGLADVQVADVPSSCGIAGVVERIVGMCRGDDVGAEVLAQRAPYLHWYAVARHEVRPEGQTPSF